MKNCAVKGISMPLSFKNIWAPIIIASVISCIQNSAKAEPNDPFALLNLPAKPFNYENIPLPVHYLAPPGGSGEF